MMFRFTVFAAASFAIAIAAGCSSDDKPQTDGGPDARIDVAQGSDAVAQDGGVCGPVDVSGFKPAVLTPPNAPHSNKCTTQQVSDYAQCQGAKMSVFCTEFADGKPGATCRQCIETQTVDPRWGVIVFAGSGAGTFNVEGCVDDALSQVSQEKANSGAGSCGDVLFASYGCQQAACSACRDEAFSTCATDATQGGCKSYNALFESPTGPCATLLGDAAPADANNCFPDASISDATLQEVDWLTRIVGYMCGS